MLRYPSHLRCFHSLFTFISTLPSVTKYSSTTKMRFSSFVLSASAVAAAPFSYPLANGFPDLNATAMAQVYKLAGGTLPNGALPSSLKPNGVQALQLIAANEIFEVAYFSELLANVTNNVPGYEVEDKVYVVKALTAVVNVSSVLLPFPLVLHT